MTAADRRGAPDRRRRPTPILSRYLFVGRRRGGRRDGERLDIYVDRFRWHEWALILGVGGLATADWWWTLQHLERGVPEANPLMAGVLAWGGTAAFSHVKLWCTWLAAAWLLLHARFRWTRALLPLVLVAYLALMLVHREVACLAGS